MLIWLTISELRCHRVEISERWTVSPVEDFPAESFSLAYLDKAETYESVAIENGYFFLIPNKVSPKPLSF